MLQRGRYRAAGSGPSFDPSRTVLLVIDPVNDFLFEGGPAWEMTKSTVAVHDVIGHLRQAIDGARAAGIPVLYGPMAYTEEDYADGKMQCRCGINRLMFELKMFLAGSWGADFHPELKPAPGEVVLLPHKGSDVFQTDLPDTWTALGTRHIVIIGMTANLYCESTGRHAVEKGFDVTFLSDAIGAENMIAYEASIRVNYPLIANAVMKVDEFIASLATGSGSQLAAAVGDTVLRSDRGEIGTVKAVVDASAGDGVPYMTVSTGLLGLGSSLHVPLDTVTKRAGTTSSSTCRSWWSQRCRGRSPRPARARPKSTARRSEASLCSMARWGREASLAITKRRLRKAVHVVLREPE